MVYRGRKTRNFIFFEILENLWKTHQKSSSRFVKTASYVSGGMFWERNFWEECQFREFSRKSAKHFPTWTKKNCNRFNWDCTLQTQKKLSRVNSKNKTVFSWSWVKSLQHSCQKSSLGAQTSNLTKYHMENCDDFCVFLFVAQNFLCHCEKWHSTEFS